MISPIRRASSAFANASPASAKPVANKINPMNTLSYGFSANVSKFLTKRFIFILAVTGKKSERATALNWPGIVLTALLLAFPAHTARSN